MMNTNLKTRPLRPLLRFPAVLDELRKEIQNGALRVGDRLPTFDEMRGRYGLAASTASRVFQELEREGLVTRRQGSGIFVAEPKKAAATGFIGCVCFGDQWDGYYWHLLSGIRQAAHEQGRELALLNPQPSLGWERVDGILAHGRGAPEVAHRMAVDIPFVALSVATRGYSSVVAGETEAAQLATEHLVKLGHRRIAYMLEDDNPLTPLRLLGYRSALAQAKIQSESDWQYSLDCESYHFHERGLASMRKCLKDGWAASRCTAIIVQNEEAAAGVIEALREAGMDVPGQVSVATTLGYPDVSEATRIASQITHVEIPLSEIGATGAQILMRQIDGETGRGETITLPPRLVVRASTSPPASS